MVTALPLSTFHHMDNLGLCKTTGTCLLLPLCEVAILPSPSLAMAPEPKAAPLDSVFAVQTTSPKGSLTTLSSTAEATSAHLARKVIRCQDAVNERRYSPSDPAWDSFAPKFEICYMEGFVARNLAEHLKYMIWWCTEFPDVTMRYHNITSDVDEVAGKAMTFAKTETRGMPVGTTRQRVQSFEWKRIAGAWKCIKTVVIEGGMFDY